MTADIVVVAVITAVASVAASTGFWNWIQKRSSKTDAVTKLLLGLAHDRIIYLGMGFVARGYITKDEYEDFFKYLYDPYSEFGGNGLAEKVATSVKALPIQGPQTEIQVTEKT